MIDFVISKIAMISAAILILGGAVSYFSLQRSAALEMELADQAERIAEELNNRQVPPPGAMWNRKHRRCLGWSRTAIYGNLKRGVGILCTPLYAGRYIWNRTRRLQDPDTKARKHFPRPGDEWIKREAPELRIVPEDLWQRVQARLQESQRRGAIVSDALRKSAGRGPKHLFSGLLKCGVCGGNYIMVNEHAYGCATHRNSGTPVCSNALRVSRHIVETRLLE